VDLAKQAATLTGKVKIISDNGGGIISDNGGGIISDNGGGVISNNSGNIIANNGGGIVANNGGGIVANNGGGLTSKVKRRVLETRQAAEFLLADAVVSVEDASGKPVLDAAGKPVTATTDATGTYHLAAKLPAGNLVLRIKVHEGGALKGGQLTAMLPQRAGTTRTAPIDTSSTLGAAYVLGKYVRGSQKTFDKLPAANADKLQADLDGTRRLLDAVPSYQPDDMTALTERLRAKAPALDQTLTEIQALLLGQEAGGDGQQALNAALALPTGLAFMPDGALLIGEPTLGRLRTIGQDGTIGTLADTIRGKVKQNFPNIQDLLVAPDGTVYVATRAQVTKIAPDGTVSLVAGTTLAGAGPVDGPATTTAIAPGRLALGPDGTLYIGETTTGHVPAFARLLAVDATGLIHRVDRDGDFQADEYVSGLERDADGSFVVLLWSHTAASHRLVRIKPGQPAQELAKDAQLTIKPGDMALAADGTCYVSIPQAGAVLAFKPDGTRTVVAGAGGPANTSDLGQPGTLLLAPDGTLLIADLRSNLVRALGPDGSWKVRAGTTSLVQAAGDLRSLALNGPFGATFDDQGRLLIAEAGGNRVARFDGKGLELVAGDGEVGYAGDGGPAVQARFTRLHRMAMHGGTLYVCDDNRIRAIAPDGTITTVAGGGGTEGLAAGQRVPGSQVELDGLGLAVAPDGRIYVGTGHNQILRIEADGTVSHVAGVQRDSSLDGSGGIGGFLGSTGDGGPAAEATFFGVQGLAFDAKGDLYVADGGNFRVRKITGLDGPNPTIGPYAGMTIAEILAHVGDGEPQINGIAAGELPLVAPIGMTSDAKGNLYVADAGTVALPYFAVLSGTGLADVFNSLPRVYSHIYRIGPDGKVTVVAGTQGKFYTKPTDEDAMVLPLDLAVGPDGRMAIVDAGANLIRILPAGSF
jgi:sugar lactone lactonase YvrE